MAHEVRVRIDTAVVANKDLEIIVNTSLGKLGTVLISKGNIEWRPTGNYVNKWRLTWDNFAAFMEANGKQVKVKKAKAT